MAKKSDEWSLLKDRINTMPFAWLVELQKIISGQIKKRRELAKEERKKMRGIFNTRLFAAKHFLGMLTPSQLDEVKTAVLELQSVKENAAQIFLPERFYATCHSCQGRCCRGNMLDSFEDWEMLYLALTDFQLPKAETLIRVKKYPYELSYCPVLTMHGCSLGDKRPMPCIRYACPDILAICSPDEREHRIDTLAHCHRQIQEFSLITRRICTDRNLKLACEKFGRDARLFEEPKGGVQ